MKSVSTNNLYQSTFMPIFQEAETEIKAAIMLAFLLSTKIGVLLVIIGNIIKKTEKKIPKDLKDRESYINGMYRKSQILINKYYQKPRLQFEIVKNNLQELTDVEIKTPKDLISYINENQTQINMWAEQKGVPYIENYPKKVAERINQLSTEVLTTSEPNKKPISLWQKAELDVRHDNQMSMLNDLVNSGVEYAWISSHPNCSKRCQKWQGKLVSLTEHGDSSFYVKMLDGNRVYSLPDIMAQTDKYGYQNNIINGFNCRHKLYPYKKGETPPADYSAKDIAKQREIEGKIRELERQIRGKKSKLSLLEKEYQLYNKSNKKLASEIKKRIVALKDEIKRLIAYYKQFCEINGYAWYEYRIK